MLHQRLLRLWSACSGHQKVTAAKSGTRFLTLRNLHQEDLTTMHDLPRRFLRVRNNLGEVPHPQELLILWDHKVTRTSVQLKVTTPVCGGGGLLYLVGEEVKW